MVKKLVYSIRISLITIFNKSFELGIYPDLFKVAKVIPLHKNGAKDNSDNYRPILLLPVLSKVLEKLMFKRMTGFVNKENLLNMKQFGFREEHSTQNTITTLVSDVLDGFKSKLFTLALFIDLRKAFDTIEHEVLLS